MAVPHWLSDSVEEPGDHSHAGLVDVETGGVGIITDVRLKLVTNGNWTEPSANLFKTPPTAAGVWFDVLFTRIDADTMEVRVRNQGGTTLMTRRFDLTVAGGTTLEYFWGDHYLVISSRRATAEHFHVALQDPEAVGLLDATYTNRVMGWGHRTNAGTAGTVAVGTLFAFDNGAATELAGRISGRHADTTGGAVYISGPGGAALFQPAITELNTGADTAWIGAWPMWLTVDPAYAFDVVKQVPIDQGDERAFIVLPITSAGGMRLAVRKPSAD